MNNTFENSIKLMDETLNKMYLKEDEDRFVSINSKENNFDASNPGSNVYSNNTELDVDKQEEKNKLTSQAIEKIKQSLKVSDELQSLLNRIKKINDDTDFNEWKVNEEDNTAILRNKNARIFKQNENLCLSHNGKIEIFKSVEELHDWLKRNNYPLPKGIVLHESILIEKEEEKSKKIKNTQVDWSDDPYLKSKYDASEMARLHARYANTRWGEILQHHWEDLGKSMSWTPEDIQKHKEQYIKDTNPNKQGMFPNQEKQARFANDIKQIGDPLEQGRGKGYNDLNWWMGNDPTKADTSFKKEEASEDNQITNDEIWYLEYQINDDNENHYLNSNWREEDLISDNLETAAKFTSREDALNELKELYSIKKLPFPLKPITGLNMSECGVTCTSLGPAVQYLGNKKESLTEESNRDKLKKDLALKKSIKNAAVVYNNEGQPIAKIGDTLKNTVEAGEKNPNGFTTANGYYWYNDGEKNHMFPPTATGHKIIYDIYTSKPIGILNTATKKAYSFDKQYIGSANEEEAAYDNVSNIDELSQNAEASKHYTFTQKAGAHWQGSANRLGFYNFNKNKLKPAYENVWNEEPFASNEILQNDPTLMTMFLGYSPEKPEELNARINEINNAFGLTLTPEEPIFGLANAKNKNNLHNYQEFLKWRDIYFKPLFDASYGKKGNITQNISKDKETFKTGQEQYKQGEADRVKTKEFEAKLTYDLNKLTSEYSKGSLQLNDYAKFILNIINNQNINPSYKTFVKQTAYDAIKDYDGDGVANLMKMTMGESISFKDMFLKLLKEDDSPADFADGPTNIASDMASATTGATDTSTADSNMQDMSSDGLDDYGPEDSMSGGAPSFGDININGGTGGMGDEEMPMPQAENKKIIDVLVNENDLSQIKVKVQDLDTGKIEIKDLDEIAV